MLHNCVAELQATGAEIVNEVEVVEEVDCAIEVVVGRGEIGTEGIDEIEVVEEVLNAVPVEIGGAIGRQ